MYSIPREDGLIGSGLSFGALFRVGYLGIPPCAPESAGEQNGRTDLQFLPGTHFYNAGVRIEPMLTNDASIVIDYESAAPAFPVRTGLNPFPEILVWTGALSS